MREYQDITNLQSLIQQRQAVSKDTWDTEQKEYVEGESLNFLNNKYIDLEVETIQVMMFTRKSECYVSYSICIIYVM